MLAWWAFLQPEWRASEGLLPLPSYHPPDGSDWSSLRLTGPNGLLLVMMSFAWWGSIVGETPSWLAASKDLKLALKAMAAENKHTEITRFAPHLFGPVPLIYLFASVVRLKNTADRQKQARKMQC